MAQHNYSMIFTNQNYQGHDIRPSFAQMMMIFDRCSPLFHAVLKNRGGERREVTGIPPEAQEIRANGELVNSRGVQLGEPVYDRFIISGNVRKVMMNHPFQIF